MDSHDETMGQQLRRRQQEASSCIDCNGTRMVGVLSCPSCSPPRGLTTTTVRLPAWMHGVAESAARIEGVSLNEWLNRAISVYIERKKADPVWCAKARNYNKRMESIVNGAESERGNQ